MKMAHKILIIALVILGWLLISFVLANAQVVSGRVGVFRDSIYVNGKWYKDFSGGGGNDSVFNNIYLPNTTTQYNGVIFKNTVPFLHNYGGGGSNAFLGYNAGNFTTTGYDLSGFGYSVLFNNTEGYNNAAFGNNALYSNTTGSENSAFGVAALYSNTTGYDNSAFGTSALNSNTTGFLNSAFGVSALNSNTTGSGNSAFGVSALYSDTTGSFNSVLGQRSLFYNYMGSYNVGIGYNSGGNSGNIFNSILIGANSNTLNQGDTNEIVIGYNATGNGSNTTTIGNNSTTDTYIYGNLHTNNGSVQATGNFYTTNGKVLIGSSISDSALSVTGGVHITGGMNIQGTINPSGDTYFNRVSAIYRVQAPLMLANTGQYFTLNNDVQPRIETNGVIHGSMYSSTTDTMLFNNIYTFAGNWNSPSVLYVYNQSSKNDTIYLPPVSYLGNFNLTDSDIRPAATIEISICNFTPSSVSQQVVIFPNPTDSGATINGAGSLVLPALSVRRFRGWVVGSNKVWLAY